MSRPPTAVDVVPGFRAFVARRFGAEGAAWLAGLEEATRRAAEALDVVPGRELTGGVLSCVLEATTADGTPAVLKLTGPWGRCDDERAALERWQGRGAPLLLGAAPTLGALLLERIVPGTPAHEAAPGEVAALLRVLHVTAPAALSPLADEVRLRLSRAVAEQRVSADRAAAAAERAAGLAASTTHATLLHGDLASRNVLVCMRRGLCAIDPLPCVGDPAYDVASWAHAGGRSGRRERGAALARALGVDPDRVRRWGVVVAAGG